MPSVLSTPSQPLNASTYTNSWSVLIYSCRFRHRLARNISIYTPVTGMFCPQRRVTSVLPTNISSTCPHNMVNVGALTAEICLPVWDTPANFNGFQVLASLLQRSCSTEVNQTLHDVWPSPGLVTLCIHFGRLLPLTEFYQVQNSLCVQALHSPIFAALLHGTRVVGVSQTLSSADVKR